MYKKYKIVYDKRSPYYSGNRKYDAHYLTGQRMYLMDVYHARGYLFLRDICEHLGITVMRNILGAGWYAGSDKEQFNMDFVDLPDGSFELTFYAYDNITEFFKES